MSVSPEPASTEMEARLSLAQWLSVFSATFLVVFLAAVLAAALPPRLMDPQWQLAMAAALVNSAVFAVLAVLLLALPTWIHPASERLRRRLWRFRRWALAACLGFLLLVPLQGYAAWRFHATVTGQQLRQRTESGRKLEELRSAIAEASSHQELQSAVKKLFGPEASLSPEEFRTPMPELRRGLLARADEASRQILQSNEAQTAAPPALLLKETARLALTSLAYAVGFAFFAGLLPLGSRPRLSPGSMVDEPYFEHLAR